MAEDTKTQETTLVELQAEKVEMQSQLDGLQEKLDVASKRVQELEADLQSGLSDKSQQEIVESKKELYKAKQQILHETRELKKSQESFAIKEKTNTAKAIAAEHGVDVKEIINMNSEAEMLAYALGKKVKLLEDKAKATPKYEAGSPQVGATNVLAMSDKDFNELWEKQKREAASKR